ncbi:LexA-binding, inner membrane-associated putative hydrolase [Halogranum rubrum]|uniref:LexA-binding, inner membrane-associated putative hydrolase n=1 Tax=Halogranum rubrum TaxID=553466 RepID=A0A1I4BLC6_9EURY|nr:metal-dependent hydrolase [Halogranum rubrum]SFK68776.1 LexA-binding, inner membrane-associated putative hydrolase [Halogranum rubrum]
MWPWGHLAVGYLLYSLYSHRLKNHRPTNVTALVVAFGTQFPDLVDKPLAWTVSLLPTGRSLAHSLLTASLVLGVVLFAVRRYRRAEAETYTSFVVAFGIGYLSHLAADGLYPLLGGEFANLAYLVWPLLPLPVYDTNKSIFAHFLTFQFDTFALFEFGLVALALVVWWADGVPGVRPLIRPLTQR